MLSSVSFGYFAKLANKKDTEENFNKICLSILDWAENLELSTGYFQIGLKKAVKQIMGYSKNQNRDVLLKNLQEIYSDIPIANV